MVGPFNTKEEALDFASSSNEDLLVVSDDQRFLVIQETSYADYFALGYTQVS